MVRRWVLAAAGMLMVAAQVPAATEYCAGDCIGDDVVTVDELITLVNLALGNTDELCDAGDTNADGQITVDEIVTAVNRALDGCPPPTPTPLDLSGNWSGDWQSSQAGGGGSLAAALTQSDTIVTGTLELSGSPCFSGGTLSGTLTQAQWSTSMWVAGGGRVDLTGSVDDPVITGSYQVVSGGMCTGDTGTFVLRRAPEVLVSNIEFIGRPSLFVRGTNLMWTDGTTVPLKSFSLVTHKQRGMARTVAWNVGEGLASFVIDGSDIYWYEVRRDFHCKGWGATGILHKTSLRGSGLPVTTVLGGSGSPGASDIFLHDGYVYWSKGDCNGAGSVIEAVPVDGTTPVPVLTTTISVAALQRDGDSLYWAEASDIPFSFSIRRLPFAGGPPTTVVESSGTSFGGMVVHEENIFYSAQRSWYPESFDLLRVPSTGGLETTLVTGVQGWLTGLATDGTDLYWLDAASLKSIPVAGGAPTLLVDGLSTARDLRVSGGVVIWTEGQASGKRRIDRLACSDQSAPASPGAFDGSNILAQTAAAGGCVLVLAQDLDGPNAFLLQGDALYWAEVGRIAQLPITGGPVVTVDAWLSGPLQAATADATTVYLSDFRENIAEAHIKSVPIRGGTLTALAEAFVSELTTDGVNLYWIKETTNGADGFTEISRMETTGGPVTVLVSDTHAPVFSAAIAVAHHYVYWLETADTVKKVSIDGGSVVTVITGLSGLRELAVDDAYVYVVDTSAGIIQRVPVGGGSPVTLASGLHAPVQMALDDDDVFWIDAGSVGTVAKTGGSQRLLAHLSWTALGNAIALDDASMYWTDIDKGTIQRLTPK